jgi:hypothetical protein
MADKDKSVDLFGIKPIGKAVEIATKGSVEGAGAFLSRICLPAAEEFGLLLKDRVSSWRQNQAAQILQKTESKLGKSSNANQIHAHPRLVMLALEQGSWNDADEVQEAWAGLLASACDSEGKSQDNLIFMNLLAQMTTLEVHLLNYMCCLVTKYEAELSLPACGELRLSSEELCSIAGSSDLQSLDIQLDHLREIGIMATGSGIIMGSRYVNLQPSALALNLYVRAQGSKMSVTEYFGPLQPLPPHMSGFFIENPGDPTNLSEDDVPF